MRFSGKLHSWVEDRGFGFIRPDGGGQDIFVHVSALPVPRPQAHEALTFEVALNAEGKKKATQVRRQVVESAALASDRAWVKRSQRASSASTRRPYTPPSRVSPVVRFVIGLLIVAGLGSFGWERFQAQRPTQALVPSPTSTAPTSPAPATSAFRCDGRTHCSQMTSCAESQFFLANCPGVKMDGNNDGVPCQQQWCGR